jgi:hypothetical protein
MVPPGWHSISPPVALRVCERLCASTPQAKNLYLGQEILFGASNRQDYSPLESLFLSTWIESCTLGSLSVQKDQASDGLHFHQCGTRIAAQRLEYRRPIPPSHPEGAKDSARIHRLLSGRDGFGAEASWLWVIHKTGKTTLSWAPCCCSGFSPKSHDENRRLGSVGGRRRGCQ